MSVQVTSEDPSNMKDMMTAAVSSSLRVCSMRPVGRRGSSSACPLISGITATPVSKPLEPQCQFGEVQQAGHDDHADAAVGRPSFLPCASRHAPRRTTSA